jgi:CHAT domain-containing protein
LLNGKPDEAWPAMENYLGRGLFELLVAFGDSPLSPAEIAREDSLNSILLGLEQQLAVLRDGQNRNGTSPGLTNRIETTRTRLLETQSARGAFWEYMRDKYPVSEGEVFPLDRVQAALEGKTAIVGWLDLNVQAEEHAAWVYVIRPSGPVFWARLTDNGAGELENLPRTYREALAGAAAWPYRVSDVAKVNWMAEGLYQQRLAPAEDILADIENLLVIPAGVMQGVPVEALIDGDGRRAGDRFTSSYTSSGTVYTWLWERGVMTDSPADRALIVGDPTLAPLDSQPSSDFAPLPSSRREIDRVASFLPGAVTLSGNNASEQALVNLAGNLREFDTIHLATHAGIDFERPERSYLLLSQENLPDPLESAMQGRRIYDGRLTVREIVREWKLDADLVTLSACRTALGKLESGEGMVGFSHAFLQTGARSVVVSLWEVDDEATSLLMGRFYKNLTGPLTRVEALSDARRWLREYTDDTGATRFRHPAYWSAFVLIGN